MTVLKHQEEPWIQGGPLLEVSFLMEFRTSSQHFIEQILTRLRNLHPPVGIARTDLELAKLKEEFIEGYPLDAKDPQPINLHSISIPAYIYFKDLKRKASIRIQQISETLSNITFDFFGSVHDAPEWIQNGIRKTDLPAFVDLLKTLFDVFEFPAGTIGYEYDSKDLFDINECWPSSEYDLSKLDAMRIESRDVVPFIYILVNKTCRPLIGLQHWPAFRKVEDTERYFLIEWKEILEAC